MPPERRAGGGGREEGRLREGGREGWREGKGGPGARPISLVSPTGLSKPSGRRSRRHARSTARTIRNTVTVLQRQWPPAL